eukprot:scaffold941_cov454-Pavlova_lutheri.AAC.1
MGTELPSTLVFDYPSVQAMADFLLFSLSPDTPEQNVVSLNSSLDAGLEKRCVALRTSSCWGDSPVCFQDYRDRCRPVPMSRWDVENKILPLRFGNFLRSIEYFDASVFSISNSEATLVDPQQRMLLETGKEALDLAVSKKLSSYVGLSTTDYAKLTSSHNIRFGPFTFSSSSGSVACGRLSFAFGLTGPAATIDTACSSSMVGAKLALDDILSSTCDGALLCGANLCIVPQSTATLFFAGMLSDDGRSKVMDSAADGYARGEACCALLLCLFKETDQETVDSNTLSLYSQINGLAVNQNGRSSSLTAPKGPAQQEVIRQALEVASMEPKTVDGLQLHSNGTLLGDPIEIGAATTVFGAGASNGFFFSSVKGFSGHEEAAAGAVLLLHCANVLHRMALCPMLHLRSLNEHVKASLGRKGTPLRYRFPREAEMLPRTTNTVAMSVSSFAAQGTNAHAILSKDFASSSSNHGLDSRLWKRTRCWIAPRISPLLGRMAQHTGGVSVDVFFGGSSQCELMDHQMLNHPIVSPTVLLGCIAGTFELLCEVPQESTHVVRNASFIAPIDLRTHWTTLTRFSCRPEGRWEIYLPLKSAPFEGAIEHHVCASMDVEKLQLMRAHRSKGDLVLKFGIVHRLLCSRFADDNGQGVMGRSLIQRDDTDSKQLIMIESMLHLNAEALKTPSILRTMEAATLPLLSTDGGMASVFAIAQHARELDTSDFRLSLMLSMGSKGSLGTFHGLSMSMVSCNPPVDQIDTTDASYAEETSWALEDATLSSTLVAELSGLAEEDRIIWLRNKVTSEVVNVLGRSIDPDEPLMEAGIDSRTGMEMRQTLSNVLGVNLPVTLLYDYQSIGAIAEYVEGEVQELIEAAERSALDDLRRGSVMYGDIDDLVAEDGKPSKLLKTLRGSYPVRPLFLAAPGVANAQSAYFIFKSFLNWSDQPIFVMEKDNDLTIEELATQNAMDIIGVQPEGPYLVGGHSYGGVVAVQIAIQLQEWGHEVGLVVLFDAPYPLQCRAPVPDSDFVSVEDANELMEMILNALGEEAVGFSTKSNEWLSMSTEERFAFFAPIWRVMRDNNMTVEEVTDQILYVAGAVKRGDQVSDLRHHVYTKRLHCCPVVYFRAQERGACDYVDDSDTGVFPHGSCWSEVIDNIEVVDVPGDHFSLLRRPDPDMSVLTSALRAYLEPFGWVDSASPEETKNSTMEGELPTADDTQEMSSYLSKMGINAGHVSAMDTVMPWMSPINAETCDEENHTLIPLNDLPIFDEPPLIIVHDITGGVAQVKLLAKALEHPCVGLQICDFKDVESFETVEELASSYIDLVKASYPNLQYFALGGAGFGALVAYEMALQLQEEGTDVAALLLMDDPVQIAFSAACRSTCCNLYKLLAGQVEVGEFLQVMKTLGSTEDYVKYLHQHRPEETPVQQWDEAIAAQCSILQDVDPVWFALYPLVSGHLSVEAFVSHMLRFDSYDEQLDFLEQYKPGKVDQEFWDETVAAAIRQVTFCTGLSDSYRPRWIFRGFTSVLYCQSEPNTSSSGHVPGFVIPGQSGHSHHWVSGSKSGKPETRIMAENGALVETRHFSGLSPADVEPTAECVAQALQAGISRWQWVKKHRSYHHSVAETRGNDEPIDADVVPLGLDERGSEEGILDGPPQQSPVRSPPRGVPKHLRRTTLGDRALPAEIIPLNNQCFKLHPATPLWMVHDERGSLGALTRLGPLLNTPCYGIQLTPRSLTMESVERLAEGYIKSIQQVQHVGPYLLGGHSFGCVVAFEMGLQLSRAGEKVALVLMDGVVQRPMTYLLHEPHWYALYSVIRHATRAKMQLDEFVERMGAGRTSAEQMKLALAFKPDSMPNATWDEAVYSVLVKSQFVETLAARYQPSGEFHGPTTLLCSSDEVGYHFQETNRQWCQGSVYTRYLPCKHTWMLERGHLKSTSSTLTKYLQVMLESLVTQVSDDRC